MGIQPVSFRLDPENLSKLKALAKREGMNSSRMINKIIKEFSSFSKETPPYAEKNQKLDKLEKELNLQKQRITIIKNQLDYLLNVRHGKGFDEYKRTGPHS